MRTFREMRHYIKQNQQFITRSEINQITETEIIHPVIDRLLSLPDKQI